MNRATEMDKDLESRATSILAACSLVILTLTRDRGSRSVSDPFTKSLKKDNRYLGVDLSSNLDWKEHIDRTVKKANSVLGFLRRNLRINICHTFPSTPGILCLYLESSYRPIQAETGDGSKKIS